MAVLNGTHNVAKVKAQQARGARPCGAHQPRIAQRCPPARTAAKDAPVAADTGNGAGAHHQPRPMSLGTVAVHGGERAGRPSVKDSLTTPCVMTSTYWFNNTAELIDYNEGRMESYEYGRYGNPTVQAVQEKIQAIEGAEDCLVSASGMNAVTSMLLSLVPAGGHIVTTSDCYWRTRQFMVIGCAARCRGAGCGTARSPDCGRAAGTRGPARAARGRAPRAAERGIGPARVGCHVLQSSSMHPHPPPPSPPPPPRAQQNFLPKMNIGVTVIPPNDFDGLQQALDAHKVTLFFSESPTNPYLRCVDIERISAMCHAKVWDGHEPWARGLGFRVQQALDPRPRLSHSHPDCDECDD
jgi:hypothetical protein